MLADGSPYSLMHQNILSHLPLRPVFPPLECPVAPYTAHILPLYTFYSLFLYHKGESVLLSLPPLDYWYTYFFFMVDLGHLTEVDVSCFCVVYWSCIRENLGLGLFFLVFRGLCPVPGHASLPSYDDATSIRCSPFPNSRILFNGPGGVFITLAYHSQLMVKELWKRKHVYQREWPVPL